MITIRSETNKLWSNWSGTVTFTAKQIFYPKTIEEIVLITRRTKHAGKYLRVVGAGYSSPPLVMTDQILLSLDDISGIESINTEEQTATIYAGTKLNDLNEALAQRGYALDILGDANALSVAGALATGTHGTGMQFGILSTQVVAFTIVTADGTLLECSAQKNEDLFRAAQLSLGLLGIIVKLTLRIVPSYRLHQRLYHMELDQCLNEVVQLCTENRNIEFAWFPHTKIVHMKVCNMTDEPITEVNKWQEVKNQVFTNWGFRLGFLVSQWFPQLNKSVNRYIAEHTPIVDKIDESYKIYASPKVIKYNEIEYFVPIEHMEAVIREVEETITRNQIAICTPVRCRFVKADDVWLSPAYQRDSVAISVFMKVGTPYDQLFQMLEAIFLKYDGRPHWGKWHSLNREKAEAIFPRLVDFRRLRAMVDPYDSFLNSYLFKIFSRDRANVSTQIFSVEQTVDAIRAISMENS